MQSIVKIQRKLKELGYYNLTIDGLWGPSSQKALLQATAQNKVEIYFDFKLFKTLFNVTKLTQEVVDSINCLFDTFNAYTTIDSNNPVYVAYMLGTTWHETAHTMLPIMEKGCVAYLSKYDTGKLAKELGNTPQADGDGIKYAGRGYVQITGRNNYDYFTRALRIDLINNPDLALNPSIAAKILVIGSLEGRFTGRKLANYIKIGTLQEFINARRVINGTNEAERIARYASQFLQCIILKEK